MQEFSQLNSKQHIKELFFCILTPQSNAEKCWQAVEQLKSCCINKKNRKKVENCLKTKTIFYRNKTRYLLEAANNWKSVEKIINSNKNPKEIRGLLTNKSSKYRIRGLGLKEASHFLRNIGKSNNELAILDRHVLKQLVKLRVISKIPKLDKKNYLKIETKMKEFAKSVKIPLDALDLLLWKLESGRIFK